MMMMHKEEASTVLEDVTNAGGGCITAATSLPLENLFVMIEVAQEHNKRHVESLAAAVAVPSCSAVVVEDEDCVTVTEVTDLSTIDEITVDFEDEEENSCRTTATAVSSVTTGTEEVAPAVVIMDAPTTSADGVCRRKRSSPPLLVTTYLRIVFQHCKVIPYFVEIDTKRIN